jgi:hypothetical protein
MTTTTYKSGCLEIPLTGLVATTGGGIASVLNPEGVPLIITDVKIYVDTPSTGGANIAVGINASAVTSDTDMINALAINGAITGLAYHGMTALAAKGAAQVWGAAEYITATGSADTSGFTGRLFVQYIRTA